MRSRISEDAEGNLPYLADDLATDLVLVFSQADAGVLDIDGLSWLTLHEGEQFAPKRLVSVDYTAIGAYLRGTVSSGGRFTDAAELLVRRW